MIARIKAWLLSKNITTHAVGAAIVGFAIAYNSSAELRDYIGTMFAGYPIVVTKLGMICADIAAGIALWRNFAHSSSAAGKVAAAESILASANPPTAAAVAAATPPPKQNGPTIAPMILLAALLIPFAIAGCTSWERAAYQTLAASKATIDQAQADYESGKLPHSKPVYDAVNKAKEAQTLAVDAMVTYEQAKATNAGQTALAKAQNDVTVALEQLPAILADIKALYVKQTAALYTRPNVMRATMEWRTQ